MAKSGYILALDQGTTGTTAVVVDASGKALWSAGQEMSQIYPKPGWVEQEPEEMFQSIMAVIEEVLDETEIRPQQIEAIGIANQRETTIVWERESGQPVMNAIVWQCRRTAPACEAMKARGLEGDVRSRTGLPIDAYFSGTKIRWILDNVHEGQLRAEAGDLLFGNVDTWLLWKLTNGTVHATDPTNASRTMLFNIDSLDWDEGLLRELDIPRVMLPDVRPSAGVFGHAGGNFFAGQSIPIAGVAGDQQAALFGQACFTPGTTKNTYGTGSFVLMNTGAHRVSAQSGLIATIAWGLDNQATYAMEGSIFSTGATVQWLRDCLRIIEKTSDVEALAASTPDNGGVFLVPAFTGLGAPHWDMYARGTISGITRGTTRAHIARAALESTAYQTRDVIEAMVESTGLEIPTLRVDGGGTVNDLLMQFQSDILGIPIERSAAAETTALGAAYLAGLAVDFWKDLDEVAGHWSCDVTFEPRMQEEQRELLYVQWKRALGTAREWAVDGD